MLERYRKQMSAGRASPIELLLLCYAESNLPHVVEQAGRFDQAILTDQRQLRDWIESLGSRTKSVSVHLDGKLWEVVGIADTEINSSDSFELERVLSDLVALNLAHRAAGGGSLEESA
jgi:CRISPR/Cas system-associated protein Cas7 (RAMP superfamily)